MIQSYHGRKKKEKKKKRKRHSLEREERITEKKREIEKQLLLKQQLAENGVLKKSPQLFDNPSNGKIDANFLQTEVDQDIIF